MKGQPIILTGPAARERAVEAVREARDGMFVYIVDETRTLRQNATQWPYLAAFSEQMKWLVNGEPIYMSSEDWKAVLTAAFYEETVRMAAGFNGGVVMLGVSTREMGVKTFAEWLDFLMAAAAENGITVYDEASPYDPN